MALSNKLVIFFFSFHFDGFGVGDESNSFFANISSTILVGRYLKKTYIGWVRSGFKDEIKKCYTSLEVTKINNLKSVSEDTFTW